MSKSRQLFRQLRELGKFIVKDDLENPELISNLSLGVTIWWFSEILTLLDFFFPFDKQIEKAQIKKKIKELKRKKYAKQRNSQVNFRNPFRRIR